MTDGDALYRAIVARPEDDTPRLVYADWLDENGHEEEAEFIRLECRLEDSGPQNSDYAELIMRRDELRLWLQPRSPEPRLRLKEGWALDPRGWWYDTTRGFPRSLKVQFTGRLGGKGVKRLAAAMEDAFKLLPTRWVSFVSIGLEDLGELLKQPAITAIDRLSINSIVLNGDEAVTLIADCPRLSNLRAAVLAFPVGDLGAAALGQSKFLHRLESLDVGMEPLTPAAIRSLSAGNWFHNLRNLSLESVLTSEAFEELCRLPACPHLHTLSLANNSISVSAWREFAHSRTFPHLMRLVLRETDMSAGQIGALGGGNCSHLNSLDLGYCAIGEEGIQALVRTPWIASVQSLDLAFNRLGAAAVRAIAGCRNMSGLKYLDLGGNAVGGTGLKAIAGSTALRNLKTLLLGNCSIQNRTWTRAHAQEFIENLDMPNLRHLDLSNMPIGSRTAHLLGTEKFRKLTRLGLAGCKLTDAVIPPLLSSSTLRNLIELNLKDNNLKTGVTPLANRRVLPQLSMCLLKGNPIAPELCRKLARRPGVIVPS